MKLVSGTVTVVLVDPTISDFQPIPVVVTKQLLEAYHIEGGPTQYTPHGGEEALASAQTLKITQATDALAQAVLDQIRALTHDTASQPVTVTWDDYNPGGRYDGTYWLGEVGAAEVSGEFAGEIDFTLQMVKVNPPVALAGALGAAPAGHQRNDLLVGAETWLDFMDNIDLTWSITDDPGNNRIKVRAAVNRTAWRGAWNNATTYVVGDMVSYNGSSYVAVAANTNQAPPNANFWGVLSQGSAQVVPWGTAGPPASGTYTAGQWGLDSKQAIWACSTSGTPGTWRYAGGGPYIARVHRAAPLNLNAGTKVSFDTKTFDPNGDFDITSTYRYTCPVPGIYRCNGRITIASNADFSVQIFQTGFLVLMGDEQVSGTGNDNSAGAQGLVSCVAGDTLELFMGYIGGAVATRPGVARLYFEVELVKSAT